MRTSTGVSTEDKTNMGGMNHGNRSKFKKKQNKRITKVSNSFLKIPQLILLNRNWKPKVYSFILAGIVCTVKWRVNASAHVETWRTDSNTRAITEVYVPRGHVWFLSSLTYIQIDKFILAVTSTRTVSGNFSSLLSNGF